MDNKNKKYIKIWGEHIDLLRFIIGVIISVVLLVIAMLISPKEGQTKLVYGLIAVLIGFIINIIFIKPKRNIKIVEGKTNDN